MDSTSTISQSVITCRNSQGTQLTANLLRLKRYSVVFEVYNPYSILQLSEVLSDFRIMASQRLLYHGKAVVSSLVNTGIVLVCEATLEDGWVEMDFLAGISGRADLAAQFEEYMQDWRRGNQVDDKFKLVVADMSNLLLGVQQWLEGIDLGIRSTVTMRREEMEREVFSKVEKRILGEVFPAMETFEEVAQQVDENEVAVHKSYVRRELHPLILCSPFLYRTYTKPLGYAGDYEMVNMMVRNGYEGASAFAKILNAALLETEPVVAHRNRIDYLVETMERETSKRVGRGGKTRIFNLGCGPAMEVQRFLRESELSDMVEFDLLDFNEETIEYTRGRLNDARMSGGRGTPIRLIQRSVHQILRAATQKDEAIEFGGYDIVYCAGLFDYLSQRVCARLTDLFCKMVKPGGLVIVTNVATSNPRKAWMEYMMEWNLIYRDEKMMRDLVPEEGNFESVQVRADATGVNLFLEIQTAKE